MTKYTALLIIITLRIIFHPSNENNDISLFSGSLSVPTSIISHSSSKFINVEGKVSDNKVKLNWTVKENENADKFEIEKSIDGKQFSLAAIVFGTDNSNNDEYQFYEKAGNEKVFYRIRLIEKNSKIEYSKIIQLFTSI